MRSDKDSDSSMASSRHPAGMRSTRVLLVDDQESVRNAVYSVLESGGYDVLAASNGRDGLSICRQSIHPIALLITDCHMPQMSGLELARECSRLCGDLSVLYISGLGPDEELQAELQTPRRSFLGKPFRSVELLRKAQQLLLLESTADNGSTGASLGPQLLRRPKPVFLR